MNKITIETTYKRIVDLQRDVAQINKSLFDEPELHEEYILLMRDIDLERSIGAEGFEKRYGLNRGRTV